MSRRRLTPEEMQLWQRVTQTAERMERPKRAPERPFSKPKPPISPKPIDIQPFEVGQASRGRSHAHDTLPGMPERLAQQPLRMDKKTNTKLKRGKVEPEGRIDLHGMTLAQAQPALVGFILQAHAQDRRLVLVITGKGKNTDHGGPIPVRHGVLRHAVPEWLQMPPLGGLVLQIAQAHARHGGGGAYYVYLRRRR